MSMRRGQRGYKIYSLLILLPAILLIASSCAKVEDGKRKISDIGELEEPQPELSDAERVKQLCVQLCQTEKGSGQDLSAGPCLDNQIITDWVCDVAHSPRTEVDNIAENQCSAFREGNANHFVEVTPECGFVRSY